MRLNPNYDFRSLCGEHVLLPMAAAKVDMSRIIHLNETAAYLWEKLAADADRDFSTDDMVQLLLQEYDVTRQQAQADCETLAAQWRAEGLVTE